MLCMPTKNVPSLFVCYTSARSRFHIFNILEAEKQDISLKHGKKLLPTKCKSDFHYPRDVVGAIFINFVIIQAYFWSSNFNLNNFHHYIFQLLTCYTLLLQVLKVFQSHPSFKLQRFFNFVVNFTHV